ncbi:hypothetical protein [Hungatella sp. SB206]|uniref:hypothetical protein n=1 Tax=Hungatella sp. SB206 TaxID=2937758 RepID=UPI003DA9420A
MIDFGIIGTGDSACDYAMAWEAEQNFAAKAYRFQQWLETKSVRFSDCRGGLCRACAGER